MKVVPGSDAVFCVVEDEYFHKALARKKGDDYEIIRLFKVTVSAYTLDDSSVDLAEILILADTAQAACEQAQCFLQTSGNGLLQLNFRAERIDFGIRGWSDIKF